MIKRTSRNFKVPLVTGGQWKDHQSFQKWDPISKRLITVNCCLPQKCFEPDPVTNVTLTSMTSGSAIISWNYSGPIGVSFEVNIYQGVTEPVNTSGTPIYTVLGGTSGSTFYFSNTSSYYYVASVRVRNNCLFSAYAYSPAVQYVFTGYSWVIAAPIIPQPSNMYLFRVNPVIYNSNISIIDTLNQDRSSFLQLLGTANNIKLQKDLSNYLIVQPLSITNNGSYYSYQFANVSSSGTITNGDTVSITYN